MAEDKLRALRKRISRHALDGEAVAVGSLLEQVDLFREHHDTIHAEARRIVETLKKSEKHDYLSSFMKEYGLDSREGVAVMCLAEALLRIPDAGTADALIKDKMHKTEWEKHFSSDGSLFVNASTWGLMLTGTVVNLEEEARSGVGKVLGRLVSRVGEPVLREALRAAMRIIGGQFVLGETIEGAQKRARPMEEKGWRFSYDMLGEAARTDEQAKRYLASYLHAVETVAKSGKNSGSLYDRPGVSVKLSALHPRYTLLHEEKILKELLPRLKQIVMKAREYEMAICIDAEEVERLDISLKLFETLYLDPELKGYEGLGLAVQAYQKRAIYIIDYLAELARQGGRRIPVRLVKGAYWDTEIKRTQVLGLPGYPVFTRKQATDVSYLVCALRLLDHAQESFYPQFATHNALTLASIRLAAKEKQITAYEFQRLYGMGEMLYEPLLKEVPCRVYAPVGQHKDLLAYLIRRLLENGANTSFVHLLVDPEQSLEEILEDPIRKADETYILPNPTIPLPVHLYGDDRLNSIGVDMGNRSEVEFLNRELQEFHEQPLSPPQETTPEECPKLVARAREGFRQWEGLSVGERAHILETAADSLEAGRNEAISILMREGSKTLADAVNEVREAADFCRYYAAQIREKFQPVELPGPTGESNTLTLHGRGVFLCISPWNFPLAIFTGQVAAALAAGNAVIAKPAEQTPAIAAWAVERFKAAGLTPDALQLAVGNGRVGQALAESEGIDGLAFTGSTETAKRIERTLAAKDGPIIPLIAETGGQNAMIVDSSALLEQAVDDIIFSAFGSAGQRCSALRVLYIQQEIADELLKMIQGGMEALQVGDPKRFATDVGPVIDEEAQSKLLAHIETMRHDQKVIFQTPSPSGGLFVPPTLIEIPDISVLPGEVFGPVLHVIRYQGQNLNEVIDQINSTGYGLTVGVHSRVQQRADAIASAVRAGNRYVNRSMTGAVVGVQPFGGEGLSGTGPKAGGPHYLLRFATERVLTVNTAAIGGNLELLS